jgi:hypothetical protein
VVVNPGRSTGTEHLSRKALSRAEHAAGNRSGVTFKTLSLLQ